MKIVDKIINATIKLKFKNFSNTERNTRPKNILKEQYKNNL